MNELKKIRMEFSKQRISIIELIEEQEEMLRDLADTINFYSAELYPTIEVKCFFENLVENYSEIQKNRKIVFNKLVDEEYLCLTENLINYEKSQGECSIRYFETLNQSKKGEK